MAAEMREGEVEAKEEVETGAVEGWRQELGFASLFKHLRINLNRWIGDERTEKAGL